MQILMSLGILVATLTLIYTWVKTGGTGRFKIDYILVKDRYGNSAETSCSYPGASADSDHSLVVMKDRIKFKKIIKQKGKKKWDKAKLSKASNAAASKLDIEKKLKDNIGSDMSVEERCTASFSELLK